VCDTMWYKTPNLQPSWPLLLLLLPLWVVLQVDFFRKGGTWAEEEEQQAAERDALYRQQQRPEGAHSRDPDDWSPGQPSSSGRHQQGHQPPHRAAAAAGGGGGGLGPGSWAEAAGDWGGRGGGAAPDTSAAALGSGGGMMSADMARWVAFEGGGWGALAVPSQGPLPGTGRGLEGLCLVSTGGVNGADPAPALQQGLVAQCSTAVQANLELPATRPGQLPPSWLGLPCTVAWFVAPCSAFGVCQSPEVSHTCCCCRCYWPQGAGTAEVGGGGDSTAGSRRGGSGAACQP
jgi:hypothetical protein